MSPLTVKYKRRTFGCISFVLVVVLAILFTFAIKARLDGQRMITQETNFKPVPLVYTVALTNITVMRSFSSRLKGSDYPIMAPLTESIKEILVDIGSVVTQNQTLIKFDDRYKKIALLEAEASYLEAIIVNSNAVLNLEHHMKLYAAGVVGDNTKRKYLVEYHNSIAKMKHATAQLDFANEQLKDCTIVAPVDASVSGKYVDDAERKTINSLLIDLVVDAKLKFYVYVEDRDIIHIKLDEPAYFTVDAYENNVFTGKVYAIGSDISAGSSLYCVKSKYINSQKLLKAGMMVRAKLPIQTFENSLFVPAYLINIIGKKSFVSLYKDSKIEVVDVKTGERCHDFVEIKSGLKAGDQILLK